MALHTKKLYFRRNGVTESADLYNSQSDTGSPAMVLRDGTTDVYARLVPTTSPDASNLRVMTGGQTLAIAKQMVIAQWKWAAAAGGVSDDYGRVIAIDSSGNCYITGFFSGTATFGSTSLTSSGGNDIFVAKLNASGVWQWAVKAGGVSADLGQGIAADSSGNCYVTGYFADTATFGSTSLTSLGSNDIFVAKLNTSGVWQWAVKASGVGAEYGRAIAVDSSGNCYITGEFSDTVTFGSTSITSSGSNDIFVAKLNTSGVWQWAAAAGGINHDTGNGIAVDSSGNCYVLGNLMGAATFGSISLTPNSGDIVVAKLNTSGVWQWAVIADGTNNDYGQSIAVDSSGNCYITGYFSDTSTFGSTSITSSSFYDIFVAKLNTSGVWQWAVSAGGTGFLNFGFGIAADSSGNCYVTGFFSGTATFGSTSLTESGGNNIFVAKLNTSGVWQWAVKADASGGYGIAIDSSGNCYVTGEFFGTVTFGSTSLTSAGNTDIFVAKLGY